MRTLNAALRRARKPAPKPPPAPHPVAARSATAPARAWVWPAGLVWYVHIHGPTVRENKETGVSRPLVLVRRSDRPHEMVLARHAELPGPSRLVHRHGAALPDTDGNAVAVLETLTPPILYFDRALPGDYPPERAERVPLTDLEWLRRAVKASPKPPR